MHDKPSKLLWGLAKLLCSEPAEMQEMALQNLSYKQTKVRMYSFLKDYFYSGGQLKRDGKIVSFCVCMYVCN